MRHFISFQKRKGLHIASEQGKHSNESLAYQFNHELMKYGYVLSRDLFDRLSTVSTDTITFVYNDVISGIRRVVGDGGYEPIYRNFPQSVVDMSYHEFIVNAIFHYWSFGAWRPEDEGYLNREFAIEPVDYKQITLLEQSEFDSILTDILYSESSISSFDKEIIDWFLTNTDAEINFQKITFKEVSAYVGQRLMDLEDIDVLPTRDATTVLRVWAAYSGGDEGLKAKTRFKNPNNRQRRVLLRTLDQCYNLEESFKIYREPWLRVLFTLHPFTVANAKRYKNVYHYADFLRNDPKQLQTFNSKVESFIASKDVRVLDLLETRMGVFTRRLDHMVRLFGKEAFDRWLGGNPNAKNLITAYNHFTSRDKEQEGRGAVLAGQGKSEVVTYGALEPLSTALVSYIKEQIIARIRAKKDTLLGSKKVFIDPTLYMRPIAANNRASSLSLDGAVNGTCIALPDGKVVRMYVHWDGYTDIDLSGHVIYNDNRSDKIGWNAQHHLAGSVVYSGDNTGYSDKNAEYLDISIDKLPGHAEWVIAEARIYSGPRNFKGYAGKARAGFMLREHPERNNHWLPQTIENAMVLTSESRTAYLLALHVPTRQIVYLDLAMGDSIVSGKEDALRMRTFLNKFITQPGKEGEINWDRLNQGHVLNLLASDVTPSAEEADVVFDENTTVEQVAKYL